MDDYLNRTYQAVLAKLTPAGQAQLRKAERAWLSFVELDRIAMHAAASRLHLSPMEEEEFQRKETYARISQLEGLLYSQNTDAEAVRQNDAYLNIVYQRCLTSMTPEEIERLRKAQRAWIVFRDESRKLGHPIVAYITSVRSDHLYAFYIRPTMPAVPQAPEPVVESMQPQKADKTTPDPFERAR